jgi:hypothetical protein
LVLRDFATGGPALGFGPLLHRRQHEPCQHIDQFCLCSGNGDHLAAPVIDVDCTAHCRGLRLFSFRLHDWSCVVKKTPMAWAGRTLARCATPSARVNPLSGRLPSAAGGKTPARPAVQPRIVVAVPIDAMIGQIHRVIVMAVGHESVLPIRVSTFGVVILAGKMKPATADQSDGFAKRGGNSGQKLFSSVERPERIPSPMTGYE